jgi:hypothetical protein
MNYLIGFQKSLTLWRHTVHLRACHALREKDLGWVNFKLPHLLLQLATRYNKLPIIY